MEVGIELGSVLLPLLHGAPLSAAAVFAVYWLYRRDQREQEKHFDAKLDAHDSKNDKDFRDLRGDLHELSQDVKGVAERLARIEGHLERRE